MSPHVSPGGEHRPELRPREDQEHVPRTRHSGQTAEHTEQQHNVFYSEFIYSNPSNLLNWLCREHFIYWTILILAEFYLQ